jgi:hypothetical protein
MQKQKIFFSFLFILALSIGGYFSLHSFVVLKEYFSLRETVPANLNRWEIQEIKGKFPLKAYYSFETQGSKWEGSYRFKEPWYLNEPSAIAALKEEAKKKWRVWFNPNNPNRSSLEKLFPTGLVIRTVTCYGVLVYFFFIFRKSF